VLVRGRLPMILIRICRLAAEMTSSSSFVFLLDKKTKTEDEDEGRRRGRYKRSAFVREFAAFNFARMRASTLHENFYRRIDMLGGIDYYL
jgi:hypothetical protein